MAFHASLPLLVIGGAICGLTLVSNSNYKRTVLEHSSAFDLKCFKHGVLPPRTKYDPYVSKANAKRYEEECQKDGAPSDMDPAKLSWVTHGGASDLYRGKDDGVVQLHESIRTRTTREWNALTELNRYVNQFYVDYFYEINRLNRQVLRQVPDLTRGMPKIPYQFKTTKPQSNDDK